MSKNQINCAPGDISKTIVFKSGTVLDCYCPLCNADLVEDGQLVLKFVNFEGEEGFLKLSPILNVYELESDIQLKENVVDDDLICPHCDKSLIVDGMKCDECDAKVAKIIISAYYSRVPFYICMKTGCKWHGFKDDDHEKIMLDDSSEW